MRIYVYADIFWCAWALTSLQRTLLLQFAISVTTVDGQHFSVGDSDTQFCIQSCSKPITYLIAQTEFGPEYVHNHIGTEPSGRHTLNLKQSFLQYLLFLQSFSLTLGSHHFTCASGGGGKPNLQCTRTVHLSLLLSPSFSLSPSPSPSPSPSLSRSFRKVDSAIRRQRSFLATALLTFVLVFTHVNACDCTCHS